MNFTRVFVDMTLLVGQTVALPAEAFRHLVTVLRLREGGQCRLFNGQGKDYLVELVGVEKKSASVKILSCETVKTESCLQSHLGQAIGKGDRMDYSLQKAVELGVTEITPLFTERVNVKLSADRLQKKCQHWQSIIIAACEQSGRAIIPILHAPSSLVAWLQQTEAAMRVICDPYAEHTLSKRQSISTLAIAVGPEGGFTEIEIQQAVEQDWQPIKLGARVLRTETVSTSLLSIAQYLWGDL